MSDSALRKKQYPIRLFLPPKECPRWVRPSKDHGPLLYLAWGKRRFGKNPIPVSCREGWTQMIVLKGSPILHIADQQQPLSPGKMILIPPEVPYGWSDKNDFSQSEQLTWIWSTPPAILDRLRKEGTWYSSSLGSSGIEIVTRLHLESRRQIEIADQWTVHSLEGIRRQLDVEWARSRSASQPISNLDFRFELAVRWMKQRLDETKPIQQLQDYLQISPATLKRIFLNKAKKSPQHYFQELKFLKAKALLALPQASVKSVSLSLGYRHMNDFTRAFQRHFQDTPSRFLSAQKK